MNRLKRHLADRADTAAGIAAAACVLHCTAIPILVVFFPALVMALAGTNEILEAVFYLSGLAFAIPALCLGVKRHKKLHPLAMVSIGFAAIYLAHALFGASAHGLGWPLAIKLFGGGMLIAGHVYNYKMCLACKLCSNKAVEDTDKPASTTTRTRRVACYKGVRSTPEQ